ncbi:MAG: von Willebrand factor type A domain-containing protein [Eubacteriaceae bacterium]|nr:von Willebrand factor type A domain-containing protein [Eubacteriaceae bacterium]
MKKMFIIVMAAIFLIVPIAGCAAGAARNENTSGVNGGAGAITPNTSYESEVDFNTAKYDSINYNEFVSAADHPLSTFSTDVDTASYANVRRMIRQGSRDIPSGAVRVEEMLNYFKYNYPQPQEGQPISISTELTNTPWNEDTKILRIGIQAKDIDYSSLPPSNLVFLLDVSGSMDEPDRLPLVQSAMKLLVENLTENDVISIVVYASQEGIILEGVRADQKERIITAIDDLMAGGATAGGKGLQTAYELALRHYITNGTNRIIWCTDGDLNVGVSDNSSIGKMAEQYAAQGVFLSIFGVGGSNFNDSLLKEASNKGKGNFHFLDSLLEARKALVDEMGGTLVTLAKDVKLQADFNPAYVKGYRLIGYENRLLKDKDFNDDEVAAGALGAGHRVTAIYELVLADSRLEVSGAESRYQESPQLVASSDLMTVAVRYKELESDTSSLIEHVVKFDELKNEMSDDQKFASAVVMWSMMLYDSNFKGTSSLEKVKTLLSQLQLDDLKADFFELVQESERLISSQASGE